MEKRAQWWVNRNRIPFKVTIKDIILNWEPEQGVKFIDISFGSRKKRLLKFHIYKSDIYTAQSKIHGDVIVKDRYQIVLDSTPTRCNIKSPTFRTLLETEKRFKKITRGGAKTHNWLTKQEMAQLMKDIKDLMNNLEAYEVLDLLAGDLSKDELNFIAS